MQNIKRLSSAISSGRSIMASNALEVQMASLQDGESMIGASSTFVDMTRYHELEGEVQRARQEAETVNEELQSSNEKLQSINEELETMNEELQSANEELPTINAATQPRQNAGDKRLPTH